MENIKLTIKALETAHATTKETYGRNSQYIGERSKLFVYYTTARLLKIKNKDIRALVFMEICEKCDKHFIYNWVSNFYGDAIKCFIKDVNKLIDSYEAAVCVD